MKTARRERRRCQDVNRRNKSSSAQKNSTAADEPMKLSIMGRVIQQEVLPTTRCRTLVRTAGLLLG